MSYRLEFSAAGAWASLDWFQVRLNPRVDWGVVLALFDSRVRLLVAYHIAVLRFSAGDATVERVGGWAGDRGPVERPLQTYPRLRARFEWRQVGLRISRLFYVQLTRGSAVWGSAVRLPSWRDLFPLGCWCSFSGSRLLLGGVLQDG